MYISSVLITECTDINHFLWCLCASYRPLNSVAKTFEFPIPCCADSIEDFGDFISHLYFIFLDACSSYHKIRVRKRDKKKLVFFTPNGKKKTFKVILFSFKNTLAFYTTMMQFLRDNRHLLFNETRHTISLIQSPSKVICDGHVIIDDIILFPNHNLTLLYYFSCVAQVFIKYLVSFKLSKYNFFKDRVEYVGYENFPTASKFSILQDCSFSSHAISLLPFISSCYFYNTYCPWFETIIKPLRKLKRYYHRKDISIMGWTLSLITLFWDCKTNIVTSLLLLRSDSSRLNFLKIDWSARRMGYIFSYSLIISQHLWLL